MAPRSGFEPRCQILQTLLAPVPARREGVRCAIFAFTWSALWLLLLWAILAFLIALHPLRAALTLLLLLLLLLALTVTALLFLHALLVALHLLLIALLLGAVALLLALPLLAFAKLLLSLPVDFTFTGHFPLAAISLALKGIPVGALTIDRIGRVDRLCPVNRGGGDAAAIT